MYRSCVRTRRNGFKLIEFLAVIAIIVLFIGLALPAVQQIRMAANRVKCASHLKHLTLAVQNASSIHGHLPPLFNYWNPDRDNLPAGWSDPEAYGGRYGSIFYHLLPFIEEADLYDTTKFAPPTFYTTGVNAGTEEVGAGAGKVPIYVCPSDWSSISGRVATRDSGQRWGVGNYAANYLVFGNPGIAAEATLPVNPYLIFNGATKFPKDIPDGTSKTILFTERLARCSNGSAMGGSLWGYLPSFGPPPEPNLSYNFAPTVGYDPNVQAVLAATLGSTGFFYPALYQSQPAEGDCDPFAASSPHPENTINVGMGDGSVRAMSLKANVNYAILNNQNGVISTNVSWKSALTPSKQLLLRKPAETPADVDFLDSDWNDQ
jgi:type II secretory pathway pseudopilin PulG